ncbi:amino acid/polyamine transporter I [Apiospora kogelbergensis]|uniref:amino acid/polyamine transporter I n=1 Tax=Apiospora kogelbergensis TaxID=1337665 RepID=UPI00312FAEEF
MESKDTRESIGEMTLTDSPSLPSAPRDDYALRRIGKKPALRRSFNLLTVLGFSCTVLITWEGSLFLFTSGLQNGGPSGIIYGFILVWIGQLSLVATLAEMASMAPTSGGQYHWVCMLAPPAYQKSFGYITGWMALIGWQAALASSGLLAGTQVQSIVSLTHPEYRGTMQTWQSTLILWAVLVLIYVINVAFTTLFAKFEGLSFIIHILGFFGIIFPLAFLSEHASAEDVFGSFSNVGGWQTQGLSFCIGLMGNVFAFVGGDAAIHLSEEVHHASTVVPWSLIATILINGTMGFSMLVATLFCMGDIDAAFAEDPLYPYMPIFRNAIGSTAGAVALSAVIVTMIFVAATGCLASTSRIYWAFARDRAIPGWRFLKKTSTRTGIPRNSVLTAAVIAAILSLINIGSATAFNGVISVSIAGLMGSYFMAASLLLYRRVTGAIQYSHTDDQVVNTIGKRLTWGPWRIPGALGIANNILTCSYIIFILFFSFWPTSRELTPQNMNWAVLVTVVALVFSTLYYFLRARKIYTGPIIEI